MVLGKCKGKGSPMLKMECGLPELIPVLGSQPAGDRSHKPGGRLPLLSARPAVTSPAAEYHRPLAGAKLYCSLLRDRGTCVNNLSKVAIGSAATGIRTRDLLIASPGP